MPSFRSLRGPIAVAVAAGGAFLAVYASYPGGTAATATPALRWLLAVAVVASGVAAVTLVRLLVLDVVFVRSQGHRAPALVHAVVSLALYFALGLVVANVVFDQSLTGAIATSAVASVVLGLALQETLGNLFAGISLQVERPFRIGDVVHVGGVAGRVDAVSWRSTTVRTADEARVVVPNSRLARDPIEVYARSRTNRRRVVVPAPYDAPPQSVIDLVRRTIVGVPGVADQPAPSVRLVSFDGSSVGYEVLYWTSDYLRVPAIDAVVRERVWYAFARNGVAIPFPHEVQVPYVPPPPPERSNPAEDRARMLGEVDLFSALSADEQNQLSERSRTLLFGPGEPVLRQGQEGGALYVVARGHVEVRLRREDGGRVVVAALGPGEVVGEMSLLTGDPSSADVCAKGEAELVEVRQSDVREILLANHALAGAFADEMACRLETRSETLAEIDAPEAGAEGRASLVRRIRGFFELP